MNPKILSSLPAHALINDPGLQRAQSNVGKSIFLVTKVNEKLYMNMTYYHLTKTRPLRRWLTR